jgi:uncharacterized protein (TIGR02996 family)
MSEQALLAAVCDHPDDDAVRLVYADWCEEHGQPERAEFIRLQIDLARLPERDPRRLLEPDSPRAALEQRINHLLHAHDKHWVRELPTLPGIAWGARAFRYPTIREYRRGFIEGVAAKHTTAFRDQVEQVRARIPLRRLSIKTGRHYKALARTPGLAYLAELDLRDSHVGDGGVAALADTPHLAGLRTLGLWGNRLRAGAARALADSPYLSRLTRLDLDANCIAPDGAQALAASPNLAGLTHLRLYLNQVGPAGAEALAASPHLANLTFLGLEYNFIGTAGARAIAASPHLANLTALDLSHNNIAAEGIRALLDSPSLGRVRSLRLWAEREIEDRLGEALERRFGTVVR